MPRVQAPQWARPWEDSREGMLSFAPGARVLKAAVGQESSAKTQTCVCEPRLSDESTQQGQLGRWFGVRKTTSAWPPPLCASIPHLQSGEDAASLPGPMSGPTGCGGPGHPHAGVLPEREEEPPLCPPPPDVRKRSTGC